MSKYSNNYKSLVGKLFVYNQYYKVPWQEEHGKLINVDSSGNTYEENNIITKNYKHLAIIDDVTQDGKYALYQYACRFLHTNIESDGYYSYEALQDCQRFTNNGTFFIYCTWSAHYIQWSSDRVSWESDEEYMKWYQEHVIGKYSRENYPCIDYAAYNRYNTLKTKQLIKLIQPLAQYADIRLAS